MRHLIERVLELSDEEIVPQLDPQPSGQGTDEELRALFSNHFNLESVFMVSEVQDAMQLDDSMQKDCLRTPLLQGMPSIQMHKPFSCLLLSTRYLIGRTARGRGAGGDPTKGEAAALESEMALRSITTDTQLAIIAAGMGGGSGTGAAGHIARLAKEQGAMTIAVVTYPFKSEGATEGKMQNGDLSDYVNTVTQFWSFQTNVFLKLKALKIYHLPVHSELVMNFSFVPSLA